MSRKVACGLVTVPVAELRKRPSHASELLTQALLGESLGVMGRTTDGKWLKVRFLDDYCGWMRTWSVMRLSDGASTAWQAGLNTQVATRSAPVMDTPRISGGLVCELPLGTRLPTVRVRGEWVLAGLPDRRTGWVRRRLLGGIPARPSSPTLILRRAREFMGAPYLWGGVTPWGCDCSGLVRTVFASCGVALPRDARDQYRALQAVRLDCRPHYFKPGDLLFFGTGSKGISHVAISAGGSSFVHAYGYVREGNLRSGRRGFLPDLVRLFVAAARPLEGGKKNVDKKSTFP